MTRVSQRRRIDGRRARPVELGQCQPLLSSRTSKARIRRMEKEVNGWSRTVSTIPTIPLIPIRRMSGRSEGGKMQGPHEKTQENRVSPPRHGLYCVVVVASPFLDSLSLVSRLSLSSPPFFPQPSSFCHSFTSPIPSPLFRVFTRTTLVACTLSCQSLRCLVRSCSSDSLESKWASVRLAMSHFDILTRSGLHTDCWASRALWRRPGRRFVGDPCPRLSLATQCSCAQGRRCG